MAKLISNLALGTELNRKMKKTNTQLLLVEFNDKTITKPYYYLSKQQTTLVWIIKQENK